MIPNLLKHTTVKNMMDMCLVNVTVPHHVSERAVSTMNDQIDKFVKEVTLKAWKMAQHAKRSTIRTEDILLAMEIIQGERKNAN